MASGTLLIQPWTVLIAPRTAAAAFSLAFVMAVPTAFFAVSQPLTARSLACLIPAFTAVAAASKPFFASLAAVSIPLLIFAPTAFAFATTASLTLPSSFPTAAAALAAFLASEPTVSPSPGISISAIRPMAPFASSAALSV
jgi:hypothetical protein